MTWKLVVGTVLVTIFGFTCIRTIFVAIVDTSKRDAASWYLAGMIAGSLLTTGIRFVWENWR